MGIVHRAKQKQLVASAVFTGNDRNPWAELETDRRQTRRADVEEFGEAELRARPQWLRCDEARSRAAEWLDRECAVEVEFEPRKYADVELEVGRVHASVVRIPRR